MRNHFAKDLIAIAVGSIGGIINNQDYFAGIFTESGWDRGVIFRSLDERHAGRDHRKQNNGMSREKGFCNDEWSHNNVWDNLKVRKKQAGRNCLAHFNDRCWLTASGSYA